MNLQVTQSVETSPPPGARFAYATGDRPLAGFTIKRGIGRGGFGEVYYALSDAGKEVALKLVCRNLDVELRGVTQCLNLKHPNLLSLYDIRQDDSDQSWIVMEYIVGDSLEKVLAAHPQGMPIDDAMFWMQGMAAGVAYLHDHGIVHRDLKPGNIFCDEGIVKIGDYGLSKFMSCSRRSGQTGNVGTVHYMAPEVANGRYGKEIDIYALGVVLYEMITGSVPFEGESLGEVLMKHLTADPDLTKIAEPYRTAIARSLLKDPEARLHSVAEWMALLPRPTQAVVGGNRTVPLPSPLVVDAATPWRSAPLANRPAAAATGPAAATPWQNDAAYGPARREEPIWRLVRTAFGDLRGWWLSARLAAWQRLLILVLGVFALVQTAMLWVPMLIISTVLYGVYRVIWAMMNPYSPAATTPPVAVPIAPIPPVESATWRRWRGQRPPVGPPLASPRQRLTELFGSLLLSAVVAGVIALVMILYRVGSTNVAAVELNQYAWLALTSIVGAWSILVSVKFWEGKPGEPALQRFTMLVVGLALGWVAYAMQTALLVQLPIEHYAGSLNQFTHPLPRALYGPDGSPSVFAFLAYFGLLWLVPKWSRQAAAQRPVRMSLWLAAVSLFWAGAASFVTPFPQPWGFMLAATVSIAVQLASPWRPAKRPALRARASE
jgi:hypothetical protein